MIPSLLPNLFFSSSLIYEILRAHGSPNGSTSSGRFHLDQACAKFKSHLHYDILLRQKNKNKKVPTFETSSNVYILHVKEWMTY